MVTKQHEAMWTVDLRTRTILECSPEAAALWGYSPAEMVGLNAESLVHPSELARARAVRAEHTSGDTGVWKCVKKDGTVFHLHIGVTKGVLDERLCSFAKALPDPATRWGEFRKKLPFLVARDRRNKAD